ncbi:MAG: GNAT family N-acetyltransferase [Cyclobacteriaceae bacterium]|nr:GNAT family N-acetyltransferase [Cyclobacteriaceae bacterium]
MKDRMEDFINNIVIRKMSFADMSELMRLKNQENWNQLEQDWGIFLEQNPELCLVADFKGKVMGTVTAINHENTLAWIGMMLVDKEYRGNGVSKLLLNTIINKLSTCKTVKLDATPAGNPVYKKLGFQDEFEIYRMVARKIEIPKKKDSTCTFIPVNLRNLEEVVMFDEGIYKANRFVFFKRLLENLPEKSIMMKKGGVIRAFAFVRKGYNYTHIGPLSALSDADAMELLKKLIRNLNEKELLVDVLKDREKLVVFLKQAGFEIQRTFTRMYLKSNPYPGKVHHQYLISGPEFG